MSNEFHGTGIALSDAIVTTIRVDDEARKVAWLRSSSTITMEISIRQGR